MRSQRTISASRALALAAALALFARSGRAGDERPAAAAAAPPKVTFEDHVAPILREKCLACHNPDKKKGGLAMVSFSGLMEGGSSGTVIEAGDPDSSRLYQLVTHQKTPHMPPQSDMLPKEKLEVIRQWIAGGALENSGSKPKAADKPKLSLGKTAGAKKPEGPPPMPGPGLSLEPVVRTVRPGAVAAIAASPWAPLIALSGQKQVLLYHAESLDLLGVLPFPEGNPFVLRFARNGSLLLAGGGEGARAGRVAAYDVKTGARVLEVGEELDAVLAADLSADQGRVALGGPSKVVRIYTTDDRKLEREIKKHTDWIRAVAFSPDGVLLATGDRAGNLFVWEAETGREFLTLRGHEGAITALSWRDDSNVLASASEDTTVRLWEMENGSLIKKWGAHGGGTSSVEFAHDGNLVTAGRDKQVKLWDQNGKNLKTFEGFPDIALAATVTSDGARIAGGDYTGEVRLFAAADGKRLANLSLIPPTKAERLEIARKELDARKAKAEEAQKLAMASKGAAEKASQDMNNLQKTAGDLQTKAQQDKEAVDKAAAALAEAQKVAQASKAAADKATQDADKAQKALAEAQAKANQDQATAEKAAAATAEAQAKVEGLGK